MLHTVVCNSYGRKSLAGGVYFTIEETCNFQNIKDQLMGFVTAVLPLLHLKLFSHLLAIFGQVTGGAGGKDGTTASDASGVTTKASCWFLVAAS